MEINTHWSHSRVETFNTCPFKFRMRYIDGIQTLPPDNADNPLIIGKAMHTGIEKGLDEGLQEYFASFPVVTDLQENEALKLSILIPKVKKIIPANLKFEVEINHDGFLGYIDGLEENPDGTFNIYDFKYSNNTAHYLESPQLSLYKYYFEQMTGRTVKNLYYVMIPKSQIRQKQNEDLYAFRERIKEDLQEKDPEIVPVKYDAEMVNKFVLDVGAIQLMDYEEFLPHESRLCEWCEYKEFCQKGEKFMLLPTAERRTITNGGKKKIWIYGAPFSGKTTFVDKAPNPLNLNTDGNIAFVTMPYVPIKDVVETVGTRIRRTFAWQVFKDTISELEKKDNDFNTIVVDLLEDTREMCRLYEYDKNGIEHESDAGYGKGWDIVKTEYLSTIRRLFSLDYDNIVVISHELVSEIKKRSGQTITKITPNMPENIANKIAGMVDIVARVVVDDEGKRWLNFKSNEFVFGGGRLAGIEESEIPLDWDALMGVFDRTRAKTVNSTPTAEKAPETPQNEPMEGDWTDNSVDEGIRAEEEPAPRRRRREEPSSEPAPEPTPEPAPTRRRRRTRE